MIFRIGSTAHGFGKDTKEAKKAEEVALPTDDFVSDDLVADDDETEHEDIQPKKESDSDKDLVIVSLKDYMREQKKALKRDKDPRADSYSSRDAYNELFARFGNPKYIDEGSNLYWDIPYYKLPMD